MKEHTTCTKPIDEHFPWAQALGVGAGVLVLSMTLATIASIQVGALAGIVAIPTALLAWHLYEDRKRHREWIAVLDQLPVPFALASEPGFFPQYVKLADAIVKIGRHQDRLFRDLALTRLETVADELAVTAQGQIVFRATETWRTAYQHLLETLRVKTYYSVAWVRTNDYWNDAPGRQSMHFNYELVSRGFRIERIHILPDELWPFEQKLPASGILEWLVEQQGRGIVVSLIRESDLANEPELLRDFAIYGDRAVGIQELDELSHTRRFMLSFDQSAIRKALTCWERLGLFSKSFQTLLDQ